MEKIKSIVVTLVLTFVSGQWGKDLAMAIQVLTTCMQEAEDTHGSGKGKEKREAAINGFMDEVEKPQGLELPTIITGDIGRRFVGLLIDGLMALSNSKNKSGN